MRQIENEARQAEELEAQAAHRNHITLAEFWDSDYLPSCVGKHPRTITFEKSIAGKWIFPIIGTISLQKITTNKVEEVILKATEQGKSPATMAKILGIISQVWNHVNAKETNNALRFLDRHNYLAVYDDATNNLKVALRPDFFAYAQA